ncbi:hypothetical protein P43SY_011591 [Pythium insidiosum]|uniref:Transmembrane protein n=1 Tax=Pythium insidiosum TaxID=114742 RepID=A0AAD5L8N8_PYTIN|nr:hypothetical protein P43SY_011591 [Pythium insidiosum]
MVDLEKALSKAKSLRRPSSSKVLFRPSTAGVAHFVFYAPLFGIPFVARLLSISRHYDELAGKVEGLVFGGLQDLAIFLQALVIVRIVQASRDSLLSSSWMATKIRCDPPPETWRSWFLSAEGLVTATTHALTGAFLSVAFMWATLPCLIDLALQIQYLPRLNRGFVSMFLKYSEQFSSSVTETITPSAVFAVLMYSGWLVLWVALVLLDAVQAPRFESSLCVVRDTPARNPGSVPVTSIVMRSFASSVLVRTAVLSVMAFVFALHASVGLDGDGNDIRWLSNAMFLLQAENALRPPTATHATITVLDAPEEIHVEEPSPR